jgi:hypothetical protein
MSDEMVAGEVWADGVLRGFFEFHTHEALDVTKGSAYTRLYSSKEDIETSWNDTRGEEACSCGGSQPVVLWIDYDDGRYWRGMACFRCMAITAGLNPSLEGLAIECAGRPRVQP